MGKKKAVRVTEENKDRSVQFEERRQKELAEARRVHAERGSKPEAQQRIHAGLPVHRDRA